MAEDQTEPAWTPDRFQQGEIYYEDPVLDDASRIVIEVKIPGKTLMRVQAREPGILAIVSRPDQQGIAIVMVEVGGERYVDTNNGITKTHQADRWALEALSVLPKTPV